MAMLAGPRKKQKISIDPRGSSWSKDENKFGQKMLERMGWSQGRGLGAKEDGRLEHIKISHKDDTRGVGCSKSQADNWISHQDDFNSLLASLNQNYTAESGGNSMKSTEASPVMSLEKKSKSAKSRVHYQKFTKGKDLSSRPLEDLDCIFGRRKHKKHSNTCTTDAATKTEDKKTEMFGVQTFQSGDSMQGYFAKKMAKRNASNENHVNDTSDDTTDKEEPRSKDTAKDSCERGLQTFNSPQSVQDYFAQKMAQFKLGSRGKEIQPEQNPESKPEELAVESDCVKENVANEEENIASDSKRKIKQKKRKHNKDELLNSEWDSEPSKKKKKKRKKGTVTDKVEDKLPNVETDGVFSKEMRKKVKKDKKRKKEAELLTDGEPGTESTSITPCITEVTEMTTAVEESDSKPRRKSVRFRNPITSILGEIPDDLDKSSGDCRPAADIESVNDCANAVNSNQNVDAVDLSNTAKQNGLGLENTYKNKKKKSKKSKRAKVEESNVSSPNADESNVSLNANADDTDVSLNANAEESDVSFNGNADSSSENEPCTLVISGDNEPVESQKGKDNSKKETKQKDDDGLGSMKTHIEKKSVGKSKATAHLNLIKPELGDLPSKFVGSNINKIPGYSRRSCALSISL